jgi:hypothetical protein
VAYLKFNPSINAGILKAGELTSQKPQYFIVSLYNYGRHPTKQFFSIKLCFYILHYLHPLEKQVQESLTLS